jgi:hypothetical protein
VPLYLLCFGESEISFHNVSIGFKVDVCFFLYFEFCGEDNKENEIENLMNKKFFKEKTKDSSLLSIFL